jgi:hypothetical protein
LLLFWVLRVRTQAPLVLLTKPLPQQPKYSRRLAGVLLESRAGSPHGFFYGNTLRC